MKLIMQLADKANRYIEDKKPWVMIKKEAQRQDVQKVCTQGLNLFRILIIYLTPVIPEIAEKAKSFFNEKNWNWNDVLSPILGVKINKYIPLLTRVEKEKVDNMMISSNDTTPKTSDKPEKELITIDDFLKVDLRVAHIDDANEVEGADKLLELTLDLGESSRKVFAGIKEAYDPKDLIGRHVIVAANLAPRKMRFGVSEGMVLAAGPGEKDIFLLSVDTGAKPGMKVK
jgi:methionyl-tRNA synthetase